MDKKDYVKSWEDILTKKILTIWNDREEWLTIGQLIDFDDGINVQEALRRLKNIEEANK